MSPKPGAPTRTRPRKSSPPRGQAALTHQRGKALAEVLSEFPAGVGTLSWGDRLNIIDAWVMVLDGTYAHLPLKKALYGFDPVRALEHLRRQVPLLDDLQFHRELTTLINHLRDAHTQYAGPHTLVDAVATLPFLIEAWGPPEAPSYVVSKVSDRRLVKDPRFVEGVTLKWWNAVPFDRALDVQADRETGGRPDARRARVLESATFRSLGYGPPPDEHWVVIGYRDLTGKDREVRLPWRVVYPGRAPTASHQSATRTRHAINPAAEAVRRAKKLMFKPTLWKAERSAAGSHRKGSLAKRYQDFLSARTVKTRQGAFGYLRIWSFDVDDDQQFIEATLELLRDLPERGLVIDLRDNPGGFIWAAERLLQVFTPNPITPTKFALRTTPVTVNLATTPAMQGEFGPWADSLSTAEETGEPYSMHLPITSVEQCNDIGQQYSGPIVTVVDANTYSSGDLFTAGIVDNRIGPVVCIGTATGAGGANVWTSDDLRAAMAATDHPLPDLPDGISFTVALRRAVRSGAADGTLIEDAGIAGQPYAMTEHDIFRDNADLLEHCGELLANQPSTRLEVTRRAKTLTIETAGLDALDIYGDGHPACPEIALQGDGTQRIPVPAASRVVEVVGIADDVVRQRRRVPVVSRRH